MPTENRTGENRCWPCTVANSVVGLCIAWLPLAAAFVNGDPAVITGTAVWGLLVTGFTAYHLLGRGYLPLAEPLAKRTGLHERVGAENERDRE